MFTAWRVSHAERRAEREEAGEEDSEEDETPVVIPSSAVTMHPKGTPAPTPTVEVQVSSVRKRVDLSNDMTWRQMIAVGVRRVVLARGELDKLEGPKYAARRAESCAERREKPREQGIGRRRRRRRTRQTRATRQRRKRQEGERREWDDREVA